MTRHEKIQKMNIEEMAEFLLSVANDCTNCCTDCDCEGEFVCPSRIQDWLKSEHKEKITLSEVERIILENIDEKYFNYIARNKNGSLYLYFAKPYKNNDAGIWKELSYMHCEDFYMFKNLFQFITWDDEEPYNIEELLKQ